MDKQHIENIQNFISRKIQKARNQVDNNCPELALKTLGEVEFYTRASLQLGLLSSSYQDWETEIIGNIQDKIVRLIKIERRII